jgi:hypothetical protein
MQRRSDEEQQNRDLRIDDDQTDDTALDHRRAIRRLHRRLLPSVIPRVS